MATNLLLLAGDIFEGSVVDEQKDMSLFFRRDESRCCAAASSKKATLYVDAAPST